MSYQRILELSKQMRSICEQLEEIASSNFENEEVQRIQELAGVSEAKPSAGMSKAEK